MALEYVIESVTHSADARGKRYDVNVRVYGDISELGPRRLTNPANVGTTAWPQRGTVYFDSPMTADLDEIDPTAGLDGWDIRNTTVDTDSEEGSGYKGLCYQPVTFHYVATLPSGGGSAGNRPDWEDEDDPTTWEPRIEVRELQEEEVAELLPFLGIYQAQDGSCDPCDEEMIVLASVELADTYSSLWIEKDTCQPVTNCLGQKFKDPPMRTVWMEEISVSEFVNEAINDDSRDCYRGSVNETSFKITLTDQKFSRTFAKHTCQLTGIRYDIQSRKYENASGNEVTQIFWKRTFVFVWNPRGWYLDAANVGTERRARAGDPDGFGGTVPTPPTGQAPVAPIKGPDGYPVTKPYRLNATGDLAEVSENPWYMRYLRGHEKNWNDAALGMPGV